MTRDTPSGLSPGFQEIADRAHFLRGKAIGAYAQIEFGLADICFQAWEWPAYHHLKRQLPFKGAARVEEIARLFMAEGPLAKYWKDLEPLVTQLSSYEKNRHLFAHGHLMLSNSSGAPVVHFRLYVLRNGGVELQAENWTLEYMESIASDIAAYGHRLGRLLGRIYAEQRLK